MPVVRYNEPQIKEAAQPVARVDADAPVEAFGGGRTLATGMNAAQNLGKQTTEIIVEQKKRADDLRVTEAYAELVKYKNDAFWNPKTGAMTRKGKDSLGAVEEYTKNFDSYADKLEENFANEEQRAAFKKVRQQERLDFDGQLNRHVGKEMSEFEKKTAEAAISATRDDAILNWSSPGKVEEALERQEKLLQSYALKEGMDGDLYRQELVKTRSGTHLGVIQRMLVAGQDRAAKKYYEKHGGEENITGDDAKTIDGLLKEGSLKGESERAANFIMNKYAGDYKGAMAAAGKVGTTELNDATRDRVKNLFRDIDEAKQQATRNFNEYAGNYIDSGKPLSDLMLTPQWQHLSTDAKENLKQYAKKRNEKSEIEPNGPTYYRLMDLAADRSRRQEFLNEDLISHVNEMTPDEVKELIRKQKKLKAGDGQTEKDLDGYRSDSQIVNDALLAAKIDPTSKPGSQDSKRAARFRAEVDDEIITRRRNGEKILNDDVQAIVDRKLQKWVDRGFFWNDYKYDFELNKQKDTAFEPDIPKEDMQQIKAALQKHGLPVTNENVMKYYQRGNK